MKRKALEETDAIMFETDLTSRPYEHSNTRKLIRMLLKESRATSDTSSNSYFESEFYQKLKRFGLGWTSDEALAMALFCFINEEDPMKMLACAANHSGDSDTVACVCG